MAMQSLFRCLAAMIAVMPPVSATPAPSAVEKPACNTPPGWVAVEQRDPLFVIFGELHGTVEAPAFVGGLACALASRGEHILLGIEHNAFDDPGLQEAWKLPVDRFAEALSRIGWRGRADGVSSEAMFAMLVRLHSLKEQGASIRIVAFNGFRNEEQSRHYAALPSQGPHEAAQAENIALAAASEPYDRVIILVGNLHARKDEIEWRGERFEPMARRLARKGKTLTLDMRYATGSSWSCQLKPGLKPEIDQPIDGDALDCSNHPAKGNADHGDAPFVELGADVDVRIAGKFDGIFWVGAIRGSPPLLLDN